MAPAIARYRTALRRTRLSRPVQLALADGLITDGVSVFDYGCGRGDDIRRLRKRGIECAGWDPVFRANAPRTDAGIVNLGYVLNVIEDPAEREETLRQAWELASSVLVVSARLRIEGPGGHDDVYNDGYITRLGTFQRYYEQGELRDVIVRALGQNPVSAGPGVFYVFRCPEARESFVAARLRTPCGQPRIRQSDVLYAEHRELLQPLVDFVSLHGRVPESEELSAAAEIVDAFGSLRRAFAVVRRVTGAEHWSAIRKARSCDILVYLALARFDGRPRFTRLPVSLQRDIRALFSTYKAACTEADALLSSAGDQRVVDRTCAVAVAGKKMPSALYIHRDALPLLAPVLRVYEGCAREYIGIDEQTNIVKLHRKRPAVSYLAYPAFERDPHPVLARSLVVSLDGPTARFRAYAQADNPPILHRKEEFVADDHPLRAKFTRLTRQEESWGLYANPSEIGTKRGWEAVLRRYAFELRGHRLVRAPAG